jgi:hypothetical protein
MKETTEAMTAKATAPLSSRLVAGFGLSMVIQHLFKVGIYLE